jgi:hypothetical protein
MKIHMLAVLALVPLMGIVGCQKAEQSAPVAYEQPAVTEQIPADAVAPAAPESESAIDTSTDTATQPN